MRPVQNRDHDRFKTISLTVSLSVACFRLMRTYKELVDLAASCANSARLTTSPEIACQLWRMVMEFQEKATTANRQTLVIRQSWL